MEDRKKMLDEKTWRLPLVFFLMLLFSQVVPAQTLEKYFDVSTCKLGFKDKDKIVIEAIFDEIDQVDIHILQNNEEKVATTFRVKINEKYGLLDDRLNYMFPAEYDNIIASIADSDLHNVNDIIILKKGRNYTLFQPLSGVQKIIRCDTIETSNYDVPFEQKFLLIKKGKKQVLTDLNFSFSFDTKKFKIARMLYPNLFVAYKEDSSYYYSYTLINRDCEMLFPYRSNILLEPYKFNGKNYCLAEIKKSAKIYGEETYTFQILDENGNILTPELQRKKNYSNEPFSIHISCMKDSLYGMIDQSGKELVPFEYEVVEDIEENDLITKMLVKKKGKYGVVDFANNFIVPLNYDSLKINWTWVNGVSVDSYIGIENDTIKVLNNQGKIIFSGIESYDSGINRAPLKVIKDGISYIKNGDRFEKYIPEVFSIVRFKDENLFFNATGEIINRTNHEFRKLNSDHVRYFLFDINESMIYDEKGIRIFSGPGIKEIYGYSGFYIPNHELTITFSNGFKGVLNLIDGKYLFSPKYYDIRYEQNDNKYWVKLKKDNPVLACPFGWKMIDPFDKEIMKFLVDEPVYFGYESLSVFTSELKYGVMNSDGKIVLGAEYDYIYQSNVGFMLNKNDKWGIYSSKGLIAPKWDVVYTGNDSYGFVVFEGSKMALCTAGESFKRGRFYSEKEYIQMGSECPLLNTTNDIHRFYTDGQIQHCLYNYIKYIQLKAIGPVKKKQYCSQEEASYRADSTRDYQENISWYYSGKKFFSQIKEIEIRDWKKDEGHNEVNSLVWDTTYYQMEHKIISDSGLVDFGLADVFNKEYNYATALRDSIFANLKHLNIYDCYNVEELITKMMNHYAFTDNGIYFFIDRDSELGYEIRKEELSTKSEYNQVFLTYTSLKPYLKSTSVVSEFVK